MSQDKNRETAQKVINKVKWWDMLSRFIDVLRINIYIIDSQGGIILPPEEGRYGGRLLTDRSFQLMDRSYEFIKNFHPQGHYLEYVNIYGLSSYAIPIHVDNQTIAYVIVGPVALNKKLENSEYKEIASTHKVSPEHLISEINSIRVVSHLMMNSILDLLAEIVKDNVELSVREIKYLQQKEQERLPKEINEAASDIATTVRLDELLVILLDVALKMTNTECGSVMVIDEECGDLTIKAAKGLDQKKIADIRVKIGEGVAGIAAQDNASFIINGDQVRGEKNGGRIKAYLKRPEIRHALVMPLVAKSRVFGVLSLHTKGDESKIEDNFDNLQYLSRLLSSAF